MDVAARYGGDEFVVICSLATPEDLAVYGRRLVRLVHDSRFAPAEEAGLRVTVSGGGALVAVDDTDDRAALERAEDAMYAANQRGRGELLGRGRRRRPVTTPAGGELRRNPVSGKLTIVAPARAARPADAPERDDPASPPCPFCAGNEALTPPEVDALRPSGGAANGPGWRVRVVPNKYPALAGRHEVIVHAPAHGSELEDLGDEALAEVLDMWQRRIAAQLDGGAAAVTLIGNLGAGSGASLEHPHEQLFATPVVPSLLLDEILEAERHRNRYGSCVLCDQVEAAGERLVLAGDVTAWVPEASRFNGELWLAPAAHEADFRAADTGALAPALRARSGRGQGRDRRCAAQLLAAHGAGGPARPVPLAPGAGPTDGDHRGLRAGQRHRSRDQGPGGRGGRVPGGAAARLRPRLGGVPGVRSPRSDPRRAAAPAGRRRPRSRRPASAGR